MGLHARQAAGVGMQTLQVLLHNSLRHGSCPRPRSRIRTAHHLGDLNVVSIIRQDAVLSSRAGKPCRRHSSHRRASVHTPARSVVPAPVRPSWRRLRLTFPAGAARTELASGRAATRTDGGRTCPPVPPAETGRAVALRSPQPCGSARHAHRRTRTDMGSPWGPPATPPIARLWYVPAPRWPDRRRSLTKIRRRILAGSHRRAIASQFDFVQSRAKCRPVRLGPLSHCRPKMATARDAAKVPVKRAMQHCTRGDGAERERLYSLFGRGWAVIRVVVFEFARQQQGPLLGGHLQHSVDAGRTGGEGGRVQVLQSMVGNMALPARWKPVMRFPSYLIYTGDIDQESMF